MISEITEQDFKAFWPSFQLIIKAQDSYAFDPDMGFDQAYQLWCELPLQSFVYKEQGRVLASYYIKANAMGPSKHICNCGYMVSAQARGKGIAKKLCEHSQLEAKNLGFSAMQFNSVVSSNQVAIKLWEKLGFNIIGTIPKAYKHYQLGFIDSHIMYKSLTNPC
jgi:ribosomal protein S18 acetylase RimI-like enzyme